MEERRRRVWLVHAWPMRERGPRPRDVPQLQVAIGRSGETRPPIATCESAHPERVRRPAVAQPALAQIEDDDLTAGAAAQQDPL